MAAKSAILDTNYIIRLVVRDLPAQTDQVLKLIENSPGGSLVVSDVVFAEAVFVLEKVYEYERKVIAQALSFVLHQAAFQSNAPLLSVALEAYTSNQKLSFVDCYALAMAGKTRAQLLTFDRDLQKAHDTI